MYVTRRLSDLAKSPDSVSEEPDGRNSGYLVIEDEESDTYSSFGLFKNTQTSDTHTHATSMDDDDDDVLIPAALNLLPLSANRCYEMKPHGNHIWDAFNCYDDVVLIPVLGRPLSANRYYAIRPHENHKGEAFTCSRAGGIRSNGCFFPCIKDVKSFNFDTRSIFQQIEIVDYSGKGYYHAKSINLVWPPPFPKRTDWKVRTKTPKHYKLGEALGVDAALRVRLPEFAFPLSLKTSETVIVGKWYCPSVFIEDKTLEGKMDTSMFYQVTLEQRWEQIYACTNNDKGNAVVDIDVTIDKETANMAGVKATCDDTDHVLRWQDSMYINYFTVGEKERSVVGLSCELVLSMRREQARGGFSFDGGATRKRQERVQRVEIFGGTGQWEEFGCYVLVESYAITRLDGTQVMACEFWHTHNIRTKWL